MIRCRVTIFFEWTK